MAIKGTSHVTKRNGCRAADGCNLVSLYAADVEQYERLTQEQEIALVKEMIRRREETAELLRAVLLKACDALAVDALGKRVVRGQHRPRKRAALPARSLPDYVAELKQIRAIAEPQQKRTGGGLRRAIAGLVDKVRLRGLEVKLGCVAERVRRERERLRTEERSSDACPNARSFLADVPRDYGLSAEEIDFVAGVVSENRTVIESAQRRLVESNLRLVLYLARRAKWPGAELSDLIQEGNIALMNAAESFDPDRGVAFGTFAAIAVQRAIHRFGATAAQLIRVPESVRSLRRRVQQTAQYLTSREGVAPSWDKVAEYLGLSRAEVLETIEDSEVVFSLDAALADEFPLSAIITDPKATDAEAVLAGREADRLVRDDVARLEGRSRRVIEARYSLDGDESSSLANIGRELGLTRERARQIEAQALRALRTRERTSGTVSRKRSSPHSSRRNQRPR